MQPKNILVMIGGNSMNYNQNRTMSGCYPIETLQLCSHSVPVKFGCILCKEEYDLSVSPMAKGRSENIRREKEAHPNMSIKQAIAISYSAGRKSKKRKKK